MGYLIPNHDALLDDPRLRQEEWNERGYQADLDEERADLEGDDDDDPFPLEHPRLKSLSEVEAERRG